MLKELLKDFNLKEEQIDKLNQLREVCLEYNTHTNLTSITDEEEFNVKHILDSLSILKVHNLSNKKILDVGSGGGFPGLVLAIVLEDSEIVMLDSNNKKVKYMDHAIKELGLSNASTIYSRVEEANIEEQYDIVVSRAVAALNVLIEITAFAAKVDGEVIFYKGTNLDDELPTDWTSIDKLGLSFNKDEKVTINSDIERRIISFNKISKTLEGYPRMYSQIKSDPIY